MKKSLFRIVLVGLLLSANLAWAVRVSLLYQAVLPVTSQSTEERNKMLQQGLSQVLIKISGNNQILMNPKVKSHLNAADRLIQEFSYTNGPTSAQPYLLQMSFDSEGVNRILRDANVPIWGQNRPLILILLESEGSNRPVEIISNDSSPEMAILLKQIADQRGLPIIFPIMDVTDLNQVNLAKAGNMPVSSLTPLIKRYTSDGILSGKILCDDHQGCHSEWKLMIGDFQIEGNATGTTANEVLSAIVNEVTSKLATRYAAVLSNKVQSTLTLKIIGVNQADDFTQLINYIQRLTPVADVQTLKVSGSEITLLINLRSDAAAFLQLLAIGQKLTSMNSDENESPLTYEWHP